MAKTNHFRTVIFTEDFGTTHKKGEEFTCDGMLASSLVHLRGVAVYKVEPNKTPVEIPKQVEQEDAPSIPAEEEKPEIKKQTKKKK